jgi:hypothetical protein
MRYFWTFFWTFALIHMASYVLASMQGAPYEFGLSSIVSLVVAVLIIVIASILPNEPVEH